MNKVNKYRKMKIERLEPDSRLVVLSSTFTATLDKTHYFPKHISLFCYVQDPRLADRLFKITVDTLINAEIHTDFSSMRNYLDAFEELTF